MYVNVDKCLFMLQQSKKHYVVSHYHNYQAKLLENIWDDFPSIFTKFIIC